MTFTSSAGGALAAVGLLYLGAKVLHIIVLLRTFAKPSQLSRYAHQTNGKEPWALVTGASGGIGKELAHELALKGFNVVLHGRSTSKLGKVEEELTQAHPHRSFRILVLDAAGCFSTASTLAAEVSEVLEDIKLTVVINNAGGATDRSMGPIDHLSPDKLIYDASVNALFPTLLLNALIPLLNRNTPALIINISSLADIGLLHSGSYTPSKAYLTKLSETIDREMQLEGRDMEVLCIRVGNVWGTGQTMAQSKHIFAPDASTMAKAILARVGCGRHSMAGYWGHALQLELFSALPTFGLDYFLASLAKDWDAQQSNKKE